jgi:arginyl-tRNA synthetase
METEQLVTEVPPRTELGDLAFPIAFELAKKIGERDWREDARRGRLLEALKPALKG